MSKVYESITELVGRTPLLRIKNYEKEHNLNAKILVKLEYYNPAQSIKDRIAYAMIEQAEKEGKLKPGYTVVEVTSGNTGIGLAAIAASKGYKFRVYIQDDVSEERFKVIKAYGGEIIKLSEVPAITRTMEETGGDFMAAVAALDREVLSKEKNIFFTNQSENKDNPGIHERTTGPEIWEDTEGKIDILVANVGTGGTVTGTARYLKKQNKDIYVAAIQPSADSLPSETNPNPEQITGVHPFEGIPESQVPAVLDKSVIDEKLEVSTAEAYRAAREVAKSDGILVGASSGAAIAVAAKLAQRSENAGKTIVAVLPDTGLRYLSTKLFDESYKV